MGGDRRFVGVVLLWRIAASSRYYTVFAATPFFREAFSLSGVALGAIVAVLTLGYILFLVPVGTLIDARGKRSALLIGLTLLAVGAGAVTVAPSYPAVLAVVIALGAAYAGAMSGTNKAILEASGLHAGTSRSGSSRSGSPRAVRSARWSSPDSRVPGARASSRSRVSRLP